MFVSCQAGQAAAGHGTPFARARPPYAPQAYLLRPHNADALVIAKGKVPVFVSWRALLWARARPAPAVALYGTGPGARAACSYKDASKIGAWFVGRGASLREMPCLGTKRRGQAGANGPRAGAPVLSDDGPPKKGGVAPCEVKKPPAGRAARGPAGQQGAPAASAVRGTHSPAPYA